MYGCTVIRRALIRHGTLDLITGELAATDRQEWVTGPCGTPLFSELERQRGECSSCMRGWTHPENYRVDEAQANPLAGKPHLSNSPRPVVLGDLGDGPL